MKILISRPDKIGDVVLALHAVKQLKILLPDVKVYMHLSKITIPLVEMVKFIDGVVALDEDLLPYQFDAVVDLMAKSWTSRMYVKAKIPLRIGNAARWFRYRFHRTISVRRSQILMNEAEYNWQLIRELDISLKNKSLSVSLTKDDLLIDEDSKNQDKYVIIMPGITASAIPWEEKNWVDLAKLISKKNEAKVLILLGPAEKKSFEHFTEVFQEHNLVEVRLLNDFKSLFKVLSLAKSYIGPSTGVTHLASVFKLPGLALYSEVKSLHPRRWQPFQSSLKVLSMCRRLHVEDVCTALAVGELRAKEPLARKELSAFVICYNEENNIRRCLESIKWCDEIVVLDSGSTDNTVNICKEFTDKIIHQPWLGNKKQKQMALNKCTKAWVINIDADEEVSFELRNRIEAILSESNKETQEIQGYYISRIVYYLNCWWDKGGWYPEYRLRFFQRQATSWGGTDPHEKAVVVGKVQRLKESIYHYTYGDTLNQIHSLTAHSAMSATRMSEAGVSAGIFKLTFRAPFRFMKFFIIKRGYRYGKLGFVVGMLEAYGTLFKYVRLWELNNNQAKTSKNLEQQVCTLD